MVGIPVAVAVALVVATIAFCCLDRLLTGPTEHASVVDGAMNDVVLVITLAPTPGSRPWYVVDEDVLRTTADRFARCEVLRTVDGDVRNGNAIGIAG